MCELESTPFQNLSDNPWSIGAIKWKFASGGSVVSGASVVDGTVFWGSGYHTKALGLPYDGHNQKLYAFSVAKP